ncbi:hypothetical protein [Parabacteroides sp. Marseille-P3160]|uniref:hypothetical protein n=1 Tax=Parabacteroides sp. Marseille-P3160 TaxID=1917887 RepID=UPI0009BA7DF2|nr:hypothetical protein [Parabacteroides sp. Marseille-P3160]
MITQKSEKEFYRTIYSLVMEKEAEFFYYNDTQTILKELSAKFWGENLLLRMRLLTKLLYFDSFVNASLKEELRAKSAELGLLMKDIPE